MGMDPKEAREQQDKEYEAARKAGAAVERHKGVPLKGFEDAPVLRYPRQATFHPLKYLRGLCRRHRGAAAGSFFANSPVIKVEELEDSVRVVTEQGQHRRRRTRCSPRTRRSTTGWRCTARWRPTAPTRWRSRCRSGSLPDALYWDMADPYHYVRLNPGPGTTDYLIAGGADHKSGEADDGDVRFEAIDAWIRALVPQLGKEVTRWSGQVLDTIDYCGLIGRNPGNKHVYVACGDSGQGMTHGALAGILLVKDLILTGKSPWQAVYEPDRKTADRASSITSARTSRRSRTLPNT